MDFCPTECTYFYHCHSSIAGRNFNVNDKKSLSCAAYFLMLFALYLPSEKQQLLSVEDYGDTMAAVQGLLKKHDAFETDFAAHRDRCTDICRAGEKLIADGNHHSDSIAQRCQQLQVSICLLSVSEPC